MNGKPRVNLCPGDRIAMGTSDDIEPVPQGTLGTVVAVHHYEDWAQVEVAWDNGRQLMLCVPPDTYTEIR